MSSGMKFWTNKALRVYYKGMFRDFDERFGSRRSAEIIVPMIIDLIKPASVIDVGCGTGIWLKIFQSHGIEDYFGVNGPHLDLSLLQISQNKFLVADLADELHLERRFDVALCLEVAGYIPASRAAHLVDMLTRFSDVVVFSGAIPFQDNPEIQVNQQWPAYWANLFAEKDFVCIDCMRKAIWENSEISWWFRQNMFVAVQKDRLREDPNLRDAFEHSPRELASLVHPENYLSVHSRLQEGVLTRASRPIKHAIRMMLPVR